MKKRAAIDTLLMKKQAFSIAIPKTLLLDSSSSFGTSSNKSYPVSNFIPERQCEWMVTKKMQNILDSRIAEITYFWIKEWKALQSVVKYNASEK